MNAIEVTSDELDSLEFRLKLLALQGDATPRTRRHASRLAKQLRCLSAAMEADGDCKRMEGPSVFRCEVWEAADAVPLSN